MRGSGQARSFCALAAGKQVSRLAASVAARKRRDFAPRVATAGASAELVFQPRAAHAAKGAAVPNPVHGQILSMAKSCPWRARSRKRGDCKNLCPRPRTAKLTAQSKCRSRRASRPRPIGANGPWRRLGRPPPLCRSREAVKIDTSGPSGKQRHCHACSSNANSLIGATAPAPNHGAACPCRRSPAAVSWPPGSVLLPAASALARCRRNPRQGHFSSGSSAFGRGPARAASRRRPIIG